MGLFGSTKTTSTSNNYNYDDDQQAANYGDGLQILGADDANITVDYLADDVAKAALAEAGMFAETAAQFSQNMQVNNNDLVNSVISAAGGQSVQNEKMVRLVTFISIGTVAGVLLLGAWKK